MKIAIPRMLLVISANNMLHCKLSASFATLPVDGYTYLCITYYRPCRPSPKSRRLSSAPSNALSRPTPPSTELFSCTRRRKALHQSHCMA